MPTLGSPLTPEQTALLAAFARSCRHTIIAMLRQSQSGHPGGSLSTIDYLATLYVNIISQTGEPVIVSNGHISPAVYATLAELGIVDKQAVIDTFRQSGSPFEGHITRHVPGIFYGTGPLGIGVSVASGLALNYKRTGKTEKVYAVMGDGEFEEGQVAEMMHFASHYKLDNLILFVDNNQVQLSDSLVRIMNVDLQAGFAAAGWHVIACDGHDYESLWQAISTANGIPEKPIVILGQTVMGKGVDFMESTGRAHEATWHGNAPKPEQADEALRKLELSPAEHALIDDFLPSLKWHPEPTVFFTSLSKHPSINIGEPNILDADTVTDCRSAYGKALLDLAKANPNVVALTADLGGSVKTDGVLKTLPDQHVECGIAEQHMVSVAGSLSLDGRIPFASTFGAFMTSRAKDQARVNDINRTNVKMVATHCGLSVGEDGPTHQAIDDMGSMVGLLNTMVIEPADANQTDHIIRYIAAHMGNFYVRMGRHKFKILSKEDGTPFFDAEYEYYYGRTDVIRPGTDITLAASGSMNTTALETRHLLQTEHGISAELVSISSIKQFDETIENSVKKTRHLVTLEDHNPESGLGAQLANHLLRTNISLKSFRSLGVRAYQLSGQPSELYTSAGMDAQHVVQTVLNALKA